MVDAHDPRRTKEKKLSGDYPAIVEEIADPTGQMLVQVRVFGVFSESTAAKDLPWAEYKLPIGVRANDGYFTPVKIGDYVWVDFPHKGDSRHPRITGGMHYCPGKKPNLPHEVWGGPDAIQHQRGGGVPLPSSPVVGKHVAFRQKGALIELGDDNSIRVTQEKSGTAIEITAGGRILLHGTVDLIVNITSEAKIKVGANTSIECSGSTNIQTVGETSILSAGETSVTCDKSVTVTANSGIILSGNGDSVKGIVQGDCICAVTGKPHPHISFSVKGSK